MSKKTTVLGFFNEKKFDKTMFLNPLVDFIYYQFGLISKGPVIAVCETSVDLPFRCVIF